uniref:Small nuclear ribonucleoprotein Sm D2 n=1 Tax=Lotharella vacuolata TaxID=74820 RepID=A0A0H5BHM8_9EUKA|nr:mRNA splicing factor [Lotharella vacuolata]
MNSGDLNFGSGPFLLLKKNLTSFNKIYILTNDHHKFIGYLRSFDKHCNIILENVTEIWHEEVFVFFNQKKTNINKKNISTKEKYSPIIFLRGDTIIIISKFFAD